MADHDQGASVRQWIDIVRRARLDKTTKYVAFAIATYADGDGRRIFPGIARLVYETGLGYNAVQAALRELRRVQLLEVVRSSKQADQADEYRLILGSDLYEYLAVPDPSVAAKAIEEIRVAHRRKPKRGAGGSVHPSESGVRPPTAAIGAALESGESVVDNTVDNSSVHHSGMGVATDVTDGCTPIRTMQTEARTPIRTMSVHHSPMGATNHVPITTPTHHDHQDVRSNLAVARATDPDPSQDPVSVAGVVRDRTADTYGRHAAPIDPADNVIRVDFGAA